ncbi:hypothetical protein Y032_0345g3120 [Ancylostoma ceylanicum]|uniref:Uncharacterized protein n=2 Tax=Ancylostoma ceylanicum TaxID=53326 RepID=A0A016RXE8_9BILA|nr:hypothetical protein Y032_0345g3120 [Ancylostoma ceylanicum]
MPRFQESRTWTLLRDVPANYFRLVREVLSLRQKIVSERQTTHFLHRCLRNNVIPNFIAKKRLNEICGLPKESRQLHEIELRILRTALKTKRDHLFSLLAKCLFKERCCERFLPDHLWRRIVGESKFVCDLIRSKTKSRLQEKFRGLVDHRQNQRPQIPVTATLSSENHCHIDTASDSVPGTSRVSVIGDVSISTAALSVLDLGPSFAPVQSIGPRFSRKIVGSLQYVHDRLRYRAREEQHGRDYQRVSETAFPAMPFPRTLFKPQDPCPLVDTKFRVFATSLFSILSRYSNKRAPSNLTPTQRLGLREIRDLCARGEIKISVSDKGGEFVVISRELDMAITEHHLEDATVYRPSSPEEFRKQYRHLNKVWVETARAAGLAQHIIARLKIDLPSCPVLYTLIKTHKLPANGFNNRDPRDFKVRPIISCNGGPTDRISWLLNIILSQLLKHVPAHLQNTNMFLERLRNTHFDRECVMESFDVTSLYTNVSNEAAMQAIFELLSEHQTSLNLYGLSVRHIMTLLKECLCCSIFRWSGHYYKQIRGLAMGQRLAPTLAIAFMSKVENPVLERRPLLYCRYIDDCCIVCPTQAEMDICFNLLNQQFPHIKFTREKPIGNWLAFLNVQVHLSNGECKTRWYRKPSNKNILIHFLSAHPNKMKKSVIGNMYSTAARVSSDDHERDNSLKLARRIATSNGYPAKEHSRITHLLRSRQRVGENTEKIAFCIPFISDEMSKEVRGCLRRAGLQDAVRVVEIPPTNLRKQLVRNRASQCSCSTASSTSLVPTSVIAGSWSTPQSCFHEKVVSFHSCSPCSRSMVSVPSIPGSTAREMYCPFSPKSFDEYVSATSQPHGSFDMTVSGPREDSRSGGRTVRRPTIRSMCDAV